MPQVTMSFSTTTTTLSPNKRGRSFRTDLKCNTTSKSPSFDPFAADYLADVSFALHFLTKTYVTAINRFYFLFCFYCKIWKQKIKQTRKMELSVIKPHNKRCRCRAAAAAAAEELVSFITVVWLLTIFGISVFVCCFLRIHFGHNINCPFYFYFTICRRVRVETGN